MSEEAMSDFEWWRWFDESYIRRTACAVTMGRLTDTRW